ncbi:hypothetical protein ACHAW6_007053 [Cyclotella cf. meneghiniana]
MSEIPWCVKDSNSFRAELTQLELPPNAKLSTFDAISMYSNINLDHAMPIMQHWFESYIPPTNGEELADTSALMSALKLVIHWNICTFGDSYFKQFVGTAMGTSCAVFFENLYFRAQQKQSNLPKFQDILKRILFYRRFVDDIFLILIGECDFLWDELVHTFNDFGILKWDCPKPNNSIEFLDITLSIEDNLITTRTYQKPNNLYLYIPPHSTHPGGAAKGRLYSILWKYWHQNSIYSNFVHFSNLLFKHHLRQGSDKLKKLLEVPNLPNADTNPTPTLSPSNNGDETGTSHHQLFLHMKVQPNGIPKHEIRKIYSELCEDIFKEKIEIEQLAVAYSCPKSMGGVIA